MPKSKKRKQSKNKAKTALSNPVVSSFGQNKFGRGPAEINPKSTFKPVIQRTAVRGDR